MNWPRFAEFAALVAAIALALSVSGCAANPSVEIVTPEGAVLKLRGDVNLAASGDLGDTGGGVMNAFQDRRSDVQQTVAVEEGVTIEMDGVTVSGLTLNRTAPTAAVMRGITGIAREAKQAFFIDRFFGWMRADDASKAATEQLRISTEGETARAIDANATQVARDGIAADVTKTLAE